MSKDIDVSQASSWSEEEAEFNVKYLRDRGRFSEAEEAAEAAGVSAPGDDPHQGGSTPLEGTRQDTSVTGTNDTPEADVEKNMGKPDKVGPHGKNSDQFTPDEDDEEDDEDDYNTWSNDELRAALKERDLPQSGSKAELVARLEEDDEE